MIKNTRRRKDIPKLKDKSQLMSFPVEQPGKTTPGNIRKIYAIIIEYS